MPSAENCFSSNDQRERIGAPSVAMLGCCGIYFGEMQYHSADDRQEDIDREGES